MKNLLIIDDDHFITKILDQQFNSAGYQVSSVNSGIDAIEYLKKNKPDVILLDLELPDIGGVEILKFIRSNYETKLIPVIVVSNSYCFSGLVQAAWSAGATKFINKEECDVKELVSQVNHLLEPDGLIGTVEGSSTDSVKHTVLIADDDIVIHGVLEFFLNQAGFIVKSAFDGKQAIDIITQTPPDLIIVDGIMPEMDGFHVVEKINQNPSLLNIPIIMMTFVEDKSIREQMNQQGVVDYLIKPFNLNHLVKLVEKHLNMQLAQ